ncbi:RNA polymerase factor sigma-54 [Hydrogenophaga palleronii]|uniref:RNA polymerase factor sigma-54 n=1 Tax=Hydrogenophaga palleronii TaxID=65655 RepID=UPI00278BDC93|nr:RNA polymerase factor sigma-54 [Hydrogenophaga palleronii]
MPVITMNNRAETRQQPSISPRLQHAVRLLQMSSMDFGIAVRDVLGRNPFLEWEDELDEGRASAGTGPSEMDAEEARTQPFELENDRALWLADGAAPRVGSDSSTTSALDWVAADTPLNAHLHVQLNTLKLSDRELALARVVVESLDDDGYLRTPLSELQGIEALSPAASLHDMEDALATVQSLDPAGVGARSLQECLLLQLDEIECPQMRATARTVVQDHLARLTSRDVSALASELGRLPRDVQAACDRIRHLDPHPGWQLGASRVDYVVPDVLVARVRGEWAVQLNPAVVPKVRMNDDYVKLFQRHRSEDNAEMGAHLQEARWTMRNVEQRFSTILAVAQAIVQRQRHFLEFGAMAMKPLGLKEIADEIGVHESTVSRVTNNKYMATPTGVYELKHFFSRTLLSANGSACSGTAIRGLIQDIIEAELADHPLSDAKITEQLAQQGLVVARRTVTKYRQMLRIDAVGRRRH